MSEYLSILNYYFVLFYRKLFYVIYSIFTIIEIPVLPLTSLYLIISFIVVFIFFYIKIKYPFWNIQPVFHNYDYWNYLIPNSFIIRNIPLKTKYYKPEMVRTIKFSEANEEQINKYIDLLQCYYIPSEKVIYNIKKENIMSIFSGYNESSPYLSFYNEKKYVIDFSNNVTNILSIDNIVGCMVSRPINIYIYLASCSPQQHNGMYWDFICMKPKYKELYLSRNLIQTHEYNCRIYSPDVYISIFKKETELCNGVIPITQYKYYTYYLRKINIQKLPEHFILIRIFKENIDILHDIVNMFSNSYTKQPFVIYGIISVANLISMIENEIIYVFCLKKREHIYGIYFLKDSFTNYEDIEDGNTIQLIGSINNTNFVSIFYNGFQHALRELGKIKHIKKYQIIIIEALSHNKLLLPFWNKSYSPIFENDSAYYFYNFVCLGSPYPSEKCLFIM